MYPKNRLKTQQMPPNLVTLFAHVMSRANEGNGHGSAAQCWDDVLNPASSAPLSTSSSVSSSSSASPSGTISPGPFCPMTAQDWRKAESFSIHLQSLIRARQALCNSSSNGSSGSGGGGGGATATEELHGNSSTGGQAPSSSGEGRLSTPHANGVTKGGRETPHAFSGTTRAAAAAAAAATPNIASSWSRHQAPRVTPKELSRGSGEEPSAPIKAPGRVAASRCVNGSAEGAVASLAGSRAGPGAFETPAHSTSHHHHHRHHPRHARDAPPDTDDDANLRSGRELSPSRYPARLRSRRFPPLGSGGESPQSPQIRGLGGHQFDVRAEVGEACHEGGQQPHAGRRFSPRGSPPTLLAGDGLGASSRDWLAAARGAERGAPDGGEGDASGGEAGLPHLGHDDNNRHGDEGSHGGSGVGYGVRTRAAPRASHELDSAAAIPPSEAGGASSPHLTRACTPQMMGVDAVNVSPVPVGFRPAPPPILSACDAAAVVAAAASAAPAVRPGPGAQVVAPRPRQVLQGGGGRSGGGRPAPLLRSSVGGRNYTDNHVKQLGLIEAAVVTSATARDRAAYNLPRQGRTLTLTNVFKFIALHGAGNMYRLAMEKQVEAHTGRHSNFFDGKIDARIVGVIKRDIGDEVITKSRKFSKILLSLIAEGCSHPDCDWDHTSFTSDKIANLQARIEAQTGTSSLQFCSDPAVLLAHATATGSAGSSAVRSCGSTSSSNGGSGSSPAFPLGGSAFTGGAAAATAAASPGPSSTGGTGGAHSKRRLDLGKDDDPNQTPSPRLKKLKRAARARASTASSGAGVESTPTGDGNANMKSPPKEEDDMRAAEVLQGLKDMVGNQ